MKALTIYQPWASLIMAGAKPFEFRKRPAPASIIGKPLVIHASVMPVDRDMIKRLQIAALRDDDEWKATGLDLAKAAPVLERALDVGERTWNNGLRYTNARHGDLPWGCGLGTVIVGEAIEAHLIAQLGDSDRVDHHVWGWPLTAVTPFPEPVPARGKQGFWPWNPGADTVTF